MSDLDLSRLTIARAAKALRARELSPLELTESYLRRIERLNPRINAYITVTAERARADARRATEDFAAGRGPGPPPRLPPPLKGPFATQGNPPPRGAENPPHPLATPDWPGAQRPRDPGASPLSQG